MANETALNILYEDNHLLVVSKPAGLATMGTEAGTPSLVRIAQQDLKTRYNKPGNVYLGVVSRLDAWVSGVVVLARTSKAAARLTEQFREHRVRKIYWAVVEGEMTPDADTLVDRLFHDDAQHRVRIVGPSYPEGQEARLSYRRLKTLGEFSLLEVDLETGRKHQIRVQLAGRGRPIVGDRKYGSRRPFPVGIALHARRLSFAHPVGGRTMEFTAPVPAAWNSLGPLGAYCRSAGSL